ncbi:MAG TPA: MFS transporter [Candidatus Nanoarchaeia archaeon]|nr:MFS transporter [Candidatus Nanoarchaeia archaeon]
MQQKLLKRLLPFLIEKSVNFLNIHYLIKEFGHILVLFFNLIYLYKNGLNLWQVFTVLALTLMCRFMLRPISLYLTFRIGLRKMIIFGALNFAILYQVLYLVNGFNIWLFIYIVYSALADTFYWLPFHTYYALTGDQKNKGKHLGTREAFLSLGGVLNPLLGSFLIVSFGFYALFFVASIFAIISVLPLLKIPDIKLEKIPIKEAFGKISKKGFWLFLGDGMYSVGMVFVWPLVIFLIFNDYIVFGWLITIAMLLQSMGFLLFGRMIDDGHGRKISSIAQIFAVLVLAGRAIFAYTIPTIIVFDFFAAVSNSFYLPNVLSVIYTSSRQSKNPLWYQFFAESGWDIGSFVIACTAALIAYLKIDIRFTLIAAMAGPVIVGIVSRRHYGGINKKNLQL